MWKTPPRCVLLLKKLDATLDFQLDQVAAFLGLEEGLTVVVEAHDYRRMRAAYGWTFLESFDDDEKPQLHQVRVVTKSTKRSQDVNIGVGRRFCCVSGRRRRHPARLHALPLVRPPHHRLQPRLHGLPHQPRV